MYPVCEDGNQPVVPLLDDADVHRFVRLVVGENRDNARRQRHVADVEQTFADFLRRHARFERFRIT